MRSRNALVFTTLALIVGCSAGTGDGTSGVGGAGGTASSGPGSTTSGASGGADSGSGGGFVTAASTTGTGGSIPMNPCGTECGPVELCEGVNKGLDDDCDGTVDEDCPCGAGQATSCFKGDPSYLDQAGCFPGSMTCTENGTWGPCNGGAHATEMCFSADPLGCHPISGVPFQTVDLSNGCGNFDDNAQMSSFEVACPSGVNPCPTPMGSNFQPLQSGEYTVTYSKVVGGVTDTCTFPLFVGARGLRVELGWNFPAGGDSTDLDLHLHQPNSTAPWSTGGMNQADCGYANCKVDAFNPIFPNPFSQPPDWFNGTAPPDPVDWYKDPVYEANTCYFAPRGAGADWAALNKGCHNPRLDLDNISCDPAISDPQSDNFCAPENINVDFPPTDQWFRVAVHYYPGTSTFTGQTFPNVKIFCDGDLGGELGTVGYNNPESPVVWSGAADQDKVWLVADVLFRQDQCSKECIVVPIYDPASPGAKKPLFITDAQASSTLGPAYPSMP